MIECVIREKLKKRRRQVAFTFTEKLVDNLVYEVVWLKLINYITGVNLFHNLFCYIFSYFDGMCLLFIIFLSIFLSFWSTTVKNILLLRCSIYIFLRVALIPKTILMKYQWIRTQWTNNSYYHLSRSTSSRLRNPYDWYSFNVIIRVDDFRDVTRTEMYIVHVFTTGSVRLRRDDVPSKIVYNNVLMYCAPKNSFLPKFFFCCVNRSFPRLFNFQRQRL